MDSDVFVYTPPPPPADAPPPPSHRRVRAIVAAFAVVLAGGALGGFAVAQATGGSRAAVTTELNVTSGSDSRAIQAATTPTPTPRPKHNCPNMGGSSSNSSGATSTAYMP
jgi:hypothetical protein